jgi:hypothetical protein
VTELSAPDKSDLDPDTHDRAVREQTVAVVQRFMDAMSVLDTDAMLAEAADDILAQLPAAPPGLPREARGKEEFTGFMAGVSTLWRSFSLVRCAVHPLADQPDRAVIEYASDAVNTDGSPYRNTYLGIATVRDGKLVNFQEFFDPAPVTQCLQATHSQD